MLHDSYYQHLSEELYDEMKNQQMIDKVLDGDVCWLGLDMARRVKHKQRQLDSIIKNMLSQPLYWNYYNGWFINEIEDEEEDCRKRYYILYNFNGHATVPNLHSSNVALKHVKMYIDAGCPDMRLGEPWKEEELLDLIQEQETN